VHIDLQTFFSKPMVPRCICLGLTLLILWQVIAGVILFWHTTQHVNQQETVPYIPQDTNQETQNQGLRTAFFGEFVPRTIDDGNVKQSMLNLNIVGIIFAEKEDNSEVIIQSATGEQKAFGVGDTLPGGVVIKRITSEGVLVSRNGTLESLSFPKVELNFEQPAEPLNEEEAP
jgi:general secretion pathway protein C